MFTKPDCSCWFAPRDPEIPSFTREAWNLGAAGDRTLRRWLIRCPHGDPHWEFWLVSLTRATTGGYEITSHAVASDARDPEQAVSFTAGTAPTMRQSFKGPGDEDALVIIDQCVLSCIGGRFSPAARWYAEWEQVIATELNAILARHSVQQKLKTARAKT